MSDIRKTLSGQEAEHVGWDTRDDKIFPLKAMYLKNLSFKQSQGARIF